MLPTKVNKYQCSILFISHYSQTNKTVYQRAPSQTIWASSATTENSFCSSFYMSTRTATQAGKLALNPSLNLLDKKSFKVIPPVAKKTITKQNTEFNKPNTGHRPLFGKTAELLTSTVFCLITIKITKNNTHATISNLFGEKKTKWSISAGQLKLPGGRRKTRLSQKMVFKSCLEKSISFGYKYAVIHCSGTRGSKVRIYRFFGESIKVLIIKDTTGTAHNGCRPPKVRRV